MMALTDMRKVQICEKNWGTTALVKTTDKRRIGEIRMEAGMKESIKKKLVRSRIRFKCVGHVKRTRADAQKRAWTRRRVMPRLMRGLREDGLEYSKGIES